MIVIYLENNVKIRWIQVKEFQEKIGNKVPLRTLQRYCRDGVIPSRMDKGNWYVDLWAWEDLVSDYKTIQSETDEVDLEQSVEKEIGVSIVPTRWVKKKIL